MARPHRSPLPSRHALLELAADDARRLAAVARLHAELLAFGPMARLGSLFVREICYRVNLETGCMKLALYEVDDRPAGFVAYTGSSMTFHRDALSRRWAYTLAILALSLAQDPRRVAHLPRVLRVLASRRGERRPPGGALGELVALGVLPEYCRPDFVRRDGVHVAEELVAHAMGRLRRQGVRKMRGIVDADNKPALLFYHRLGARFERCALAGKPSVHVWFDLDGGTPPSGNLAAASASARSV